MEAGTSETSVENYFTRQYIPEENSELQKHRFGYFFFFLRLHKKQISELLTLESIR
jgi:hypothetical protein